MTSSFILRNLSSIYLPFFLMQMTVWEQKIKKIQTPENTPRLFDLVKVEDEKVRLAFYFALRDTLVANDLEEATRVAFQNDQRWRVVTLKGQIIEQSGIETQTYRSILSAL